ncbi:uncharacterized protein DNG_06760 [Cephalotrichum gorgonifer]|uniref:Uncharacterized protein n=1 Tax=Cephalotrichum gorgonifer TaxID=2041049 RepID=A0AAE8N3D3_9PEZI|nr:uncharacterized protein DNG_06760 [Cephalotrichum gorgonifer]
MDGSFTSAENFSFEGQDGLFFGISNRDVTGQEETLLGDRNFNFVAQDYPFAVDEYFNLAMEAAENGHHNIHFDGPNNTTGLDASMGLVEPNNMELGFYRGLNANTGLAEAENIDLAVDTGLNANPDLAGPDNMDLGVDTGLSANSGTVAPNMDLGEAPGLNANLDTVEPDDTDPQVATGVAMGAAMNSGLGDILSLDEIPDLGDIPGLTANLGLVPLNDMDLDVATGLDANLDQVALFGRDLSADAGPQVDADLDGPTGLVTDLGMDAGIQNLGSARPLPGANQAADASHEQGVGARSQNFDAPETPNYVRATRAWGQGVGPAYSQAQAPTWAQGPDNLAAPSTDLTLGENYPTMGVQDPSFPRAECSTPLQGLGWSPSLLNMPAVKLSQGTPDFNRHLSNIKVMWGRFKSEHGLEDLWQMGESQTEREKYAPYLQRQLTVRRSHTLQVFRTSLAAGLLALVRNRGVFVPAGHEVIDGLSGMVEEIRAGADAAIGSHSGGGNSPTRAACSARINKEVAILNLSLARNVEFPEVKYPKAQSVVLANGKICHVAKGQSQLPYAGHRGGDYIVAYKGVRKEERAGEERFRYQGQVPRTTGEYQFRLRNIVQRVWDILISLLSFKPYSSLILEDGCQPGRFNVLEMSAPDFEEMHRRWKERFRQGERYGTLSVFRHAMGGSMQELDVILEFAWLTEKVRGVGEEAIPFFHELRGMVRDAAWGDISELAVMYEVRQEQIARSLRLECDGQVLVHHHTIGKILFPKRPATPHGPPNPPADPLINLWSADLPALVCEALKKSLAALRRPPPPVQHPRLPRPATSTTTTENDENIPPTTSGSSALRTIIPVSAIANSSTSSRSFTTSAPLQKKKKKGTVVKTEDTININALKRSLFSPPPPPLRMARSRHLRHWTIHRAWLLHQRKLREGRERELMRMQQGMSDACEELRKTAGPGTRPEGYLYRVAQEKKGVYGPRGVPIEYSRLQTETPAREAWNHEWTQ